MIPKPTTKSDYVFYADGSMASIVNCILIKNGTYREFHLRPIERTRYNYQIEDDLYDKETWTIKKQYRSDLCIPLNLSPDNNVWFILCDFNGNERADLLDIFNNSLLQQNRYLLNENKSLRTLLMGSQVTQQKIAMFKEQDELQTLDKIKIMRKALGSSKKENEDEEEHEQ